MAEADVTAFVTVNDSRMCKAGFARDSAPHEKEVTAVVALNGSRKCKIEHAGDDAFNAVFPSSDNRHNASGIIVGMDQEHSNSSDEAQSKRR